MSHASFDALDAYLPRPLIRAVARLRSAGPFSFPARVVALIADLSGFTDLGEALARSGPAGA